METGDEGHGDGPQGRVDEDGEVGQGHGVAQQAPRVRMLDRPDAAASQRPHRVARASQGVHAGEHGAQIAARGVPAVSQGEDQRERADGDDDGTAAGVVRRRPRQ